MPLSSNSLIHLTSTIDALEGILSECFRLKYCKEACDWSVERSTMYVPMVSFCDIPLSQIKDHITSYGCYGIGLTKEWAIRNHLNPVLYIEGNSYLAKSYEKALSHISDIETDNDDTKNAYFQLIDIVRYTKNYQGDLIRKGITTKNYRFSDEREWRYIPDLDENCSAFYTDAEFNDKDTRSSAKESISKMRLEFEPNDIKYIIIKDENEITGIINHLRTWAGPKFTMQDVERLTTRIITSEQIRTDM